MLFFQTVRAEVYRTSQMVGFATGSLGAVGAGEGWVGANANVTVTNGSGSLVGTGLGLAVSSGDRAEVNATDGFATYNLFAAASQFPVSSERYLYYSFLCRFNDALAVSGTGERIVQANRQNSGSQFHFEVDAVEVSGRIQIGVNKPTGTAAFATNNINPGETVFVVVRQQMIVGAADDIIDLWINPPANALGLGEGSVPPPGVSTSSGVEDTSNTGPGRFYLASGANLAFDELRIASTWAEVTPSATACNPASISSDPTNQTATGDIPASFSITATGTSPTYQWQISTNGGGSWSNVTNGSGASSPNYTTPNLALADDGNRYRCIVNVSCSGGSSATSGVATVTVAAPVMTPLGLVVDDNWSDLERNNPPVATNNAIWLGQGLDASTGSLIGATASGSSRLWLGFFTDDSTLPALPVHLDTSRAIKATLMFTPNNVVANGGNSLRIGMFDYADGGTRPAGDPGGSAGNGQSVRGYMLGLNFGATFDDDTPLEIFARNNLSDGNLMGSGGLYQSLGAGPVGLLGAPAFVSGTEYTLEFLVARTTAGSVDITTTLSGGGTNWSLTVIDNTYGYHRFDAFALRPNSLETTAESFTFTRFNVEVIEAPSGPLSFSGVTRQGDGSIQLAFTGTSGDYRLWASTNVSLAPVTNTWTLLTNGTFSGAPVIFTDQQTSGQSQRFYVISRP